MNQLATQQPAELAVAPERAPITIGQHGVQIQSFDELARFCLAVSKSRLAPKGLETPEAIMVAIQHGAEIGLAPMQALQSIAVINGRPSVWGDAALALAMGRPDFVDCIETQAGDVATCTIKRAGRTDVVRSFSMADAQKAGLKGKAGPWTQYPARMLQMRARSWALRDSFPDALKGIGVAEEVRDIAPRQERAARVALVLPGEEPKSLPEPAIEAAEPPAEGVEQVTEEMPDLF